MLFSTIAASQCHIFILRVRTRNTGFLFCFPACLFTLMAHTKSVYHQATICCADQVKHLQLAAGNEAKDLGFVFVFI